MGSRLSATIRRALLRDAGGHALRRGPRERERERERLVWSPAGGPAMTRGGGTPEAQAVQAKDVVLVDAGPNPPAVADVVRAMTGADYTAARELVGRAPCVVRARIAPALAEALRVKLVAAGAHAEVREHGAAPAVAERCDVFLRDYGDRKIQVIKVVKETLKLGLRESLELVDSAPRMLARQLGRDQAEVLVHELVEAGAAAELRAHVPEQEPARPLAATIVTGAPAAAAADESASELYEVILNGCGPNKINVIKIIRERTGLGLKDSKDLAETADATIKQGIPEQEAVALMRELAAVGASVEVRGTGGAPAAMSGSIEATYDVVLLDCGASKIAVIKLIRELTLLGLKEAKEMAEVGGATVKEAVPGEEAEAIRRRFVEVGADVELVAREAAAELESGLVDVVLQSFGASKISVIKEVRAATNLGLKEAKDLVESAPCTIKSAVDVAEGRALMQRLVEVGASVRLI
jgi:large subunit ribosomal protein L7/L12